MRPVASDPNDQALALRDVGAFVRDPEFDAVVVQDRSDRGPVRDRRANGVLQDHFELLVALRSCIVVHLHRDLFFLLADGEGQRRGRDRRVIVFPLITAAARLCYFTVFDKTGRCGQGLRLPLHADRRLRRL